MKSSKYFKIIIVIIILVFYGLFNSVRCQEEMMNTSGSGSGPKRFINPIYTDHDLDKIVQFMGVGERIVARKSNFDRERSIINIKIGRDLLNAVMKGWNPAPENGLAYPDPDPIIGGNPLNLNFIRETYSHEENPPTFGPWYGFHMDFGDGQGLSPVNMLFSKARYDKFDLIFDKRVVNKEYGIVNYYFHKNEYPDLVYGFSAGINLYHHKISYPTSFFQFYITNRKLTSKINQKILTQELGDG